MCVSINEIIKIVLLIDIQMKAVIHAVLAAVITGALLS